MGSFRLAVICRIFTTN